jgi:hypothetical protein
MERSIKIILTSVIIQKPDSIACKLKKMKTTVRNPANSANIDALSYLVYRYFFFPPARQYSLRIQFYSIPTQTRIAPAE